MLSKTKKWMSGFYNIYRPCKKITKEFSGSVAKLNTLKNK